MSPLELVVVVVCQKRKLSKKKYHTHQTAEAVKNTWLCGQVNENL